MKTIARILTIVTMFIGVTAFAQTATASKKVVPPGTPSKPKEVSMPKPKKAKTKTTTKAKSTKTAAVKTKTATATTTKKAKTPAK